MGPPRVGTPDVPVRGFGAEDHLVQLLESLELHTVDQADAPPLLLQRPQEGRTVAWHELVHRFRGHRALRLDHRISTPVGGSHPGRCSAFGLQIRQDEMNFVREKHRRHQTTLEQHHRHVGVESSFGSRLVR